MTRASPTRIDTSAGAVDGGAGGVDDGAGDDVATLTGDDEEAELVTVGATIADVVGPGVAALAEAACGGAAGCVGAADALDDAPAAGVVMLVVGENATPMLDGCSETPVLLVAT